jgi:hypothetical protein
MSQINANQKEQMCDLHISYISLLAIVFFAWLASGCGASSTKTATPTAVLSPLATSSLTSTSQDTLCNSFSTPNIRLDAKMRTIPGGDDTIRIRITGLTSQFDSNSQIKLQMFRWKLAADGTPSIDAAPLSFHLETASHNGSAGAAISSNMSSVSMSDIAKYGATTGEAFFNQTDIVVQGLSFDWKVIKFVLYNNNAVLTSNDALIPEFLANPISYAANHSAVLSQLHPFQAQQGLSDADYMNQAQSFCF